MEELQQNDSQGYSLCCHCGAKISFAFFKKITDAFYVNVHWIFYLFSSSKHTTLIELQHMAAGNICTIYILHLHLSSKKSEAPDTDGEWDLKDNRTTIFAHTQKASRMALAHHRFGQVTVTWLCSPGIGSVILGKLCEMLSRHTQTMFLSPNLSVLLRLRNNECAMLSNAYLI